MTQTLKYLKETPSQTAGPFVHIGLAPKDAGIDTYDHELGRFIVDPDVPGQRTTVTGRVIDGAGAAVTDVLIEVWQADAAGRYAGTEQAAAGFTGWGRVVPDFDSGVFRFETIKPGPVMAPDGQAMAPHLNLWLVARGINLGLNTRLYFEDEAAANATDPVLRMIEQDTRRTTLIARKDGNSYRFDIRLQGPEETVFFDV